MSEEQEVPVSQAIIDLHEVTLRIPGECFFCDTIDLDTRLRKEDENPIGFEAELNFLKEKVSEPGFSPYPIEQLSWGYHVCEKAEKAFFFATPTIRLKQLGWQNLEVFRRVFPSFISLFCQEYESETSIFLLCEDTLSLARFKPGTTIPEYIYSLPVDPESQSSIDQTKSKLISTSGNQELGLTYRVLIADKIIRTTDGRFEFINHWASEDLASADEEIRFSLSAEDLWRHDLRSSEFKLLEKKRRNAVQLRWRSLKLSLVFALLLASSFIGVKICSHQVESMRSEVVLMSQQVPLVIKARELVHKLKQQKLGGIDPFGSIGRLAAHRGGSLDDPHIWFTEASFDSRNKIRLEGQGRNVAAINTFIGKLESAGVAELRIGRSGDELRKIKSAGGETTFEIELQMFEKKETAEGE